MKLSLVTGKYPFPLKFAFFALLCLLSTVAHLSLDRYFTVGGQLLGNSDFSAGPEQWEVRAPAGTTVSFDSGEARIHSSDPAGAPAVYQTVPAALLGKTAALTVTAKSVDITAGTKSWHKGRILFVQFDGDGKAIYSTFHELTSFEGTEGWQKYTGYFHIRPGAVKAKVIVVLNRATGGLYCRDFSLHEATANSTYTLAKWLLMGGWLLFAVMLFCPAMSLPRGIGVGWVVPALTVLTLTGIIVGTTIPGSMKNDLKADVIDEVKSYSTALSIPVISTTKKLVRKFTTSYAVIDITKWAHFGLFGLLTFLLLSKDVRPSPYPTLADVLMLACATEMAQLFVEHRGAHLSDVGVDMAGSAAGLMVWLAVRKHFPAPPPRKERAG